MAKRKGPPQRFEDLVQNQKTIIEGFFTVFVCVFQQQKSRSISRKHKTEKCNFRKIASKKTGSLLIF